MTGLDEQVRLLAEADRVAFGPVGFAATTLPETEAYWALADALKRDPAAVRPKLERLLRKATPAGKVYAATLLASDDPAAARDVWQRLAKDASPVNTMSGCVMGRTTLREYAAEQVVG